MNVMESYWTMLPPELQGFILLLKRNQEMFDQEKERIMKGLSKEIVMYKELKCRWALGHVKCIVKESYMEIKGCYLDREDNVHREMFLGNDFPGAIQRVNFVKSFL